MEKVNLKLLLKNNENRLVLTTVQATEKKRYVKNGNEIVKYSFYHPFANKECEGFTKSVYFHN